MAPFGPFPQDATDYPMAVALSGGADSLCLAWLASRWRGGVLALIVDHGLRAGSHIEAASTAETARSLGLDAHVLSLSGLSRLTHVQQGARHARYAALTAVCHARGILDLLVAHHRGDQIETVAMRRRAGSGQDGLAGMARCVERDGVRILRPLLEVAPMRLRATLVGAGLAWLDDPSNGDRRFERVRVRQDLGVPEGEACLMLARESGVRRDMRRLAAAAGLGRARICAEGFVRLPPELLPPDLLAALWRVIGDREYAPSPAIMAQLVRAPRPLTLHGAMLTAQGGRGGWILCRELRAVEGRVAATDGARWDGRWVFRDPEARASGMWIHAGPRARTRTIPDVVHRTMPTLCDGDGAPVLFSTEGRVGFDFRPRQRALDDAFWIEDRTFGRNLLSEG